MNLGLITEDYCYELALTGEKQPYSRAGINLIGQVPDANADGKWRHVELDLREYPSLKGTKIEQVVFWNWENQGILKLALGKNPAGATADIDNFKIESVPISTSSKSTAKDSDGIADKTIWAIGKSDNSAGEFCHEADAIQHFSPGQPLRRFARALTEYYPEVNIAFALPEKKVPAAAVLLLEAAGFDTSIGGRVSIGIKLNDEPIKLAIFDNHATKRHCIPLSGLKSGTNMLSLQRIEGGDWIARDALKLVSVDNIKPENLSILFGNITSFELDAGDDYVLGQPKIFLERACTQSDPELTIWFYSDKLQYKHGEKFVLKICSRAGATNVAMGAQIRITLNDKWIGETWFPAISKEATFHVSSENFRSGWNQITLRWVAGSEWILWDRISLTSEFSLKPASILEEK
jgi:hypothetical protein